MTVSQICGCFDRFNAVLGGQSALEAIVSNPNIKHGIGLLATAAVVCVVSILLIVAVMGLGIPIPEILGLVLYISGPFPIIPAIMAGIGAVVLLIGGMQGPGGTR